MAAGRLIVFSEIFQESCKIWKICEKSLLIFFSRFFKSDQLNICCQCCLRPKKYPIFRPTFCQLRPHAEELFACFMITRWCQKRRLHVAQSYCFLKCLYICCGNANLRQKNAVLISSQIWNRITYVQHIVNFDWQKVNIICFRKLYVMKDNCGREF